MLVNFKLAVIQRAACVAVIFLFAVAFVWTTAHVKMCYDAIYEFIYLWISSVSFETCVLCAFSASFLTHFSCVLPIAIKRCAHLICSNSNMCDCAGHSVSERCIKNVICPGGCGLCARISLQVYTPFSCQLHLDGSLHRARQRNVIRLFQKTETWNEKQNRNKKLKNEKWWFLNSKYAAFLPARRDRLFPISWREREWMYVVWFWLHSFDACLAAWIFQNFTSGFPVSTTPFPFVTDRTEISIFVFVCFHA